MLYPILKSAHLLFVMAWVAAVFYLPRLLINFAEAPGQHDVQARLLIMARRLYLFGHVMFGLSLLCGIGLIHFSGAGGWLHAKLTLVAV
ncbi:MAG: CopD family protein, partial [Arenimonas sp.]